MVTANGFYGEGGASDRFSLLLCQEDEYYFRDYSCNLWRSSYKRCDTRGRLEGRRRRPSPVPSPV